MSAIGRDGDGNRAVRPFYMALDRWIIDVIIQYELFSHFYVGIGVQLRMPWP